MSAEAFVDRLVELTTGAAAVASGRMALCHKVFGDPAGIGPLATAAPRRPREAAAPVDVAGQDQTPPIYSAAMLWGASR